MTYLDADKLWAIPAGLAAIFCMICILPALALVYVLVAGIERLTGESI